MFAKMIDNMLQKRMLQRALVLVLIFLMTAGLCACGNNTEDGSPKDPKPNKGQGMRLSDADWNKDVKTGINDLLDTYGVYGKGKSSGNYVVFDFDNTCAIFDIEEQTLIYQIETMSFDIQPYQLKEILLTGINDPYADLEDYGYEGVTYDALAQNITDDYSNMWYRYSGISAAGVSEDNRKLLEEDPYWKDFAAKLRLMYNLIKKSESADVASPWITYLYSGMSDDEVYDLTKRCLKEYSKVKTSKVTWKSPSDLDTSVGKVKVKWTKGVSVPKNINELWHALSDNNIDVWVCSDSAPGVIRAAIDSFDLHKYCSGVIGMTPQTDYYGQYKNAYDYDTGCGYYADSEGWSKMKNPTKAQTQGEGMVEAIVNAISPEYSDHGPIAGFMASTDDFNFCTELDSLALVVCFNRADRKVTDGAGLIAEIAVYEGDTLNYDLEKATENGDTLYLLQGRDENGRRSLRGSALTVKYGKTEEKLFDGSKNEEQLQSMKDRDMTIWDICDKYVLESSDEDNGLSFKTGFLETYSGYHSIHLGEGSPEM